MYCNNLKEIRKNLDISAAKLSKKLNVSQGSIVQYELGTRKPNFEFMEKLNNVLNVNLNWFVSGRGEMFLEQGNIPQQSNIDEEQIKLIFDKLLKEKGII